LTKLEEEGNFAVLGSCKMFGRIAKYTQTDSIDSKFYSSAATKLKLNGQ